MSAPAPVSRSAQRLLDLIRYREETLALHQHDPAVAAWLGGFRQDGERFLERYAGERASALVDGRTFFDIGQREEADLVEEAIERLWEIQQRKLFELQCRWRAEEVTLPPSQAVLSLDFEAWETRIEECPLVPPIAATEVEDYLAYLLSDACTDADDDFGRPREWQNYDRCRRYLQLQAEGQDPGQVQRDAVRNPGSGLGGLAAMLDDFFLSYPSWYVYCDAQAGPPNMVLYLPDHRGAKEAHYRYIGLTGKIPDPYADDDDDDEEDQPAPPPPVAAGEAPPLRVLDYQSFAALTTTLMRKLEPAELLRFHEAVTQAPEFAAVRPPAVDEDEDEDEDDSEQEIQLAELGREAGRKLRELPERLPVEAGPDWRMALHQTWVDWRKRRLATALRAAFAAYQAREQAGIRHPSPYGPNAKMQATLEEAHERIRSLILKGRELAGEPRDFTF